MATLTIDSRSALGAGSRETTMEARLARLALQIDFLRKIERTAFHLEGEAQENNAAFIVYLLEMLRAAALEERSKSMTQMLGLGDSSAPRGARRERRSKRSR